MKFFNKTVSILARFPGVLLRVVLLMVIASAPVYFALSNFAVFEPYLFPLHSLQGRVRQVMPNVIVGPYPDVSLLTNLRHRGVTVVISLLDQNLIYEKSLIRRENALSSQLDITEYNTPMNSSQPSNSLLNATALTRIQEILRNHPHDKVYIHCYLGKHRAAQVAQMLTHSQRSGNDLAVRSKNDLTDAVLR
ncbi:MAG: protein-tyrosine phosphatase family protein [Sulfuriferula sp.]